jgi:hypothetical protein
MGKHKDRLTLKFIETLKARGIANGFIVEEEYPLLKGVYYADLVWRLSGDVTPIITFEVESHPTLYSIKNAMKYFDTPSREIPKPWHHFILVLNNEIPFGTKKLLFSSIDRHNAYVFENILADFEQNKQFNRLLDDKVKGFLPVKEHFLREYVPEEYKNNVTKSAAVCADLMDKGAEEEAQKEIDRVTETIRDKIEIWDTSATKFACKELFLRLFEPAFKNDNLKIYSIFDSLFEFSYSQGNKTINAMMAAFDEILRTADEQKWGVEIAEKASEILLKLAMRFLNKDTSISEACMQIIDYATEDWPISELMSRQVLFAALLYQKRKREPKVNELLQTVTECIRVNYVDSCEKTLLLDSVDQAETEQNRFQVDVLPYKMGVLIPLLRKEIKSDIEGLLTVLEEDAYTEQEIHSDFLSSEISEMIIAYQRIEPRIAKKIERTIEYSKHSQELSQAFKHAIDNSNFLKYVYHGTGMVTTFDELVKFLEDNIDKEGLGVGVTAYGISWINFKSQLNARQLKAVKKVSKKYELADDGEFELSSQNLTFLADTLVYLGENKYNMPKLIDFLRDIDSIAKIEEFVTGLEFKIRQK